MARARLARVVGPPVDAALMSRERCVCVTPCHVVVCGRAILACVRRGAGRARASDALAFVASTHGRGGRAISPLGARGGRACRCGRARSGGVRASQKNQ